MIKSLLDFFFGVDRSLVIPPAPTFQVERKTNGTAGASVSPKTGRADVSGYDKETGTIDWGEVGTKVRQQRRAVERTAAFTAFDMALLGLPEFATLDEIKYRAGKVAWADGLSNKKAADHPAVVATENFGETTRKLYWKAYAMSHEMQSEGEEEE